MGLSAAFEDGPGEAPSIWHLCWQAALGREFFAHPSLYPKVRMRLIDAHRRPGRVLIDYLLLPTEIHLVSQLPHDAGPGVIARAVGNVVARWVREVQPVRSPVFAGPFRAHRIRSADELRREVRLLAWRPVLHGICRTPSHHPHAALRIALGLTPAQGFDARPLLACFGGDVRAARGAMRTWLAQRPTEREVRQWELVGGLALAGVGVGVEAGRAREVRGRAAAALVAAGGTQGIDGALRLLERWVVAKLGARIGTPDPARPTRATSARVRALVACLAVDLGLCSAATVARYFQRAKATLSEQMSACRARSADRAILGTPPARLVEDALALLTEQR